MANEISLTATLGLRNGYLNSRRSITRNFTQNDTTPAKASGVLSIGTTQEAIPVGDVAANGWAWFENLDATNYLEIGVVVSATFYPVIKLKAGEFCPVRIATGVTLYARANTAACLLDYDLNED